MSNAYKCVVKYIQYTFDWSEVFYVEKDTLAAAAAVFDGGFRAASLGCRHPAVYIDSVRISLVNQPRQGQPFPVKDAAGSPTALVPEPTRVCAQYRIGQSSIPAFRTLFMRGIFDSDVDRDPVTGNDLEGGRLLAARNVYFGALEAREIKVQQLMPITHTDPWDFYNANKVTVLPSGFVRITFDNVPTPPSTNRVILSGWDQKAWPGLGGHFVMKNFTSPTFDVNYRSKRAPGDYTDGLGKFRFEVYRYFVIKAADCQFRRFSSRDTKGGAKGGRGRRRPVILRSR